MAIAAVQDASIVHGEMKNLTRLRLQLLKLKSSVLRHSNEKVPALKGRAEGREP